MMKNQVLAAMDEEHVLSVVVEAGLHDAITDHHAQNEGENSQGTGAILIGHSQKTDAVESEHKQVTQHGQWREVVR